MIGNLLKAMRQKRGWSQTDLAKRCGVDQSTIHRIEVGAISPRFETVVKIARVLGVTLDDLSEEGR